jgi:hypothetical protein
MPRSRSNSHGSHGSHGSRGSKGSKGKGRKHVHHEPVNNNGNPKYNTMYWDDMPEVAHFAAKILGYSKESWDKDEEVPYDTNSFFQCTVRERQAAVFLNLGLIKKLNLWWDDVHGPTQDQASALGWTKEKWDQDYEIEDLPIDKISWDELERLQRRGAKHFGYTKATWDETWAAQDFNPEEDEDDGHKNDSKPTQPVQQPGCGKPNQGAPVPHAPPTTQPEAQPEPDKPTQFIPPLPKKDDEIEGDNKQGSKPPMHIAPLPKKDEEPEGEKPIMHIAPLPHKDDEQSGGGYIKPFQKIFGSHANDSAPAPPAETMPSVAAVTADSPNPTTHFIAPLAKKDDEPYVKPHEKIYGQGVANESEPAAAAASDAAVPEAVKPTQFIAPLPKKDDNEGGGGGGGGYVRPHEKIYGQAGGIADATEPPAPESEKPTQFIAPLPKKDNDDDHKFIKPFKKLFGKKHEDEPTETSDEGAHVIPPLTPSNDSDDKAESKPGRFVKPFKKLFGKG